MFVPNLLIPIPLFLKSGFILKFQLLQIDVHFNFPKNFNFENFGAPNYDSEIEFIKMN